MKLLFTFLTAFLALLDTPVSAYGPFEAQNFEYYFSQSPLRVSYSTFTFYDAASGTCTECKYTASRGYGYNIPGPLPTEYTPCTNKDVSWKYQADGQIIYVQFGYWQKNENSYKEDWVRIEANGTVIPTACTPNGYYGYLCTPRETRYLTTFVVVI
ncbi:hypothetical protein AA313_de0209278 [Arthrobotrys entomopaga]|nr:hypothetical protein AA313_de0209278 [Arthrobotrys entomopaga]